MRLLIPAGKIRRNYVILLRKYLSINVWSAWRNQMETFSAFLAICEGNPLVTSAPPPPTPPTPHPTHPPTPPPPTPPTNPPPTPHPTHPPPSAHTHTHTQGSVTWSFDAFFDIRMNKQLNKQLWRWWFKMPSLSLWRQCNGLRNRV